MDLRELLPWRVYLSRVERIDRRDTLLPRLAAAGFADATWFPAIEPAMFRGDARGFKNCGKRSTALGRRLILREAARRRAAAVLFLEDDVIFHDDFPSRVAEIALPEDWGMLYFGCQHIERPESVSSGLVRVRRALDTHAFAVRAPHYTTIRRILRGHGRPLLSGVPNPVQPAIPSSDRTISKLHRVISTYACLPNLAWQARSYSDLERKSYSNYDPSGRQRWRRELLAGIE